LFKAQFEVSSDYGLSEEYFSRVGDRESQFDRDASRILTAFGKKWHPAGAREEYICAFSKSKWEQLPKSLKVKHSLQKCEACYDNYSFQQLFIEKPIYCRETVVSIDIEQATENALTRMSFKTSITNTTTNSINHLLTQLW